MGEGTLSAAMLSSVRGANVIAMVENERRGSKGV